MQFLIYFKTMHYASTENQESGSSELHHTRSARCPNKKESQKFVEE